jgi:hypothetical protein
MADLQSGDLTDVLVALLVDASAELFGGASPAVTATVSNESLAFGTSPRNGPVGARRENRSESVALDPPHLLGPYRLSTSPAPGRRIVRVLVGDAIAFTLHDDEVAWAPADPDSFTLTPRPHRSLAGATHVRVDYGVDAVTAVLLGTGRAVVTLAGPPPLVERARDLALAALTLDADRLLDSVRVNRQEGDYATSRRLTEVSLAGIETAVTSDTAATSRLTLDLAVTLEVRRALREGEGTPIIRIATPGAAGTLAVAVEPEVNA